MSEATLEQRLEWLQNGLREIGKMCLQLGGADDPTARDPAPPADGAIPPVHPATPTPAPAGAASAAVGVPLKDFLAGVEDLTPEERLDVVRAAIVMLGQVFAHLPLKRTMHAIDPIQKLRLLEQRLASQVDAREAEASDRSFHDEMIEVFHSLRDLHTNYILPSGYQGKTAFLPFMIQEFFEGDPPRPRYLVTKLLPGFTHPTFKVGVTVSHWNGIPIGRAVELNAARESGSNADARHARGLESLTLRTMALTAPPDETWVIIGYQSGDRDLEVRFEWRVTTPAAAASGSDVSDPTALAGGTARVMGYDAEAVSIHRSKKSLFFPAEIAREHRMAQAVMATAGAAADGPAVRGAAAPPAPGAGYRSPVFGMGPTELRARTASASFGSMGAAERCMTEAAAAVAAETTGPLADDHPDETSLLPDFFSFRKVHTPSGEFGYIRIFSFMAFDANAFVAEFVRIAGLLPQTGLIVDVRGNGGGNILAGEQLLQVLTSRPIEPERFHFINSLTTRDLCKDDPDLSPWVESIGLALQTGETYSQGFPLTPVGQANSVGRRYPGKVVLVIDALCYSTTDIFAAGFQDHEIGTILGTSGRTGAGGANVWTYDAFANLSGFTALPKGMSFRTAVRRSTRVGAKAGVPLEDLGVRPDRRHDMTRRDLLEGNVDLIAAAAAML